jgi:peptide alpha-N-acetyltransferase
VKPDSKGQVEEDLLSTIDLETSSLEDAMSGLRLLDEWESSQNAKSAYISHAHQRWKEASAFQPK